MATRVSDFDQAQAILEERGVQWTGAEVAAIGGGRVRNFVDLDGNMLQILERPAE